ncbi:glycosyl hydrolases family 35-domain-containing protein [Cladochytrium replicatum]|nr:glycosyl hydrolases family 35-domain-containing protein [Cladochytrium replicatum]
MAHSRGENELLLPKSKNSSNVKKPLSLSLRFCVGIVLFAFLGTAAYLIKRTPKPVESVEEAWVYADVEATLPFITSVESEKTIAPRNCSVQYTERGFTVCGKEHLLLVGSIHYPRSAPTQWLNLMLKAKDAGLNTIDTYVFWNLHEPTPGEFDFQTDLANLPQFLKIAAALNLFVALRIGPYVCAEWNYGGLPAWLLEDKDMVIRTYNAPFMDAMERFVRKVVEVCSEYLAPRGGPIVLLQIENEYGLVQNEYGPESWDYVNWATDLALSLDTGVPWFLCAQNNVTHVITSCNGFYCDNWISRHVLEQPNFPSMHTELWSGWFQTWGGPRYIRPPEDLAYSTARFVARGGTYVAYYMWHGGTNFGRSAGPMKPTSYDYSAPMNEYGFPNEPTYSHLSRLHHTLSRFTTLLLNNEPHLILSTENLEAHLYSEATVQPLPMSFRGYPTLPRIRGASVIFLSNTNPRTEKLVALPDGRYVLVPRWSVLILSNVDWPGTLRVLYCTSQVQPMLESLIFVSPPSPLPKPDLISAASEKYTNQRSNSAVPPLIVGLSTSQSNPVFAYQFFNTPEPIPTQPPSDGRRVVVADGRPLEQIRTTGDTTDYIWYIRDVEATSSLKTTKPVKDVAYAWLDGIFDIDIDITLRSSLISSKEPRAMKVLRDERKKKFSRNSQDVPSSRPKTLTILSVSMGLQNYGGHLETVTKGIPGDLFMARKNITEGTWTHVIGLRGEQLNYHFPWTPGVQWFPTFFSDLPTGPTWHKLVFPYPKFPNPNPPVPDFKYKTFSLYLGTITKGMAFVNGHPIGRYWNIIADASVNSEASNSLSLERVWNARKLKREEERCYKGCEWFPDETGPYYADKCPVGCGQPSQSFYHVPYSWVINGGDVTVVLFEEVGGDPSGVYFVQLTA